MSGALLMIVASTLARDNEESHQRLAHRMDEIRTYLQEVGEAAVVTTRIRRRLFGKVVALRIDQEDHLESLKSLLQEAMSNMGIRNLSTATRLGP